MTGAYVITDPKAFFELLGVRLAPVFEEQGAVWKREGPGAEARAAALGITIDQLGGNCPVQGEGSFDEQTFYFRARGSAWQFHVGPEVDWFSGREWALEREFGTGFDAGWMHQHEAIGFICAGVEAFRKQGKSRDGL